MAKNETTKKTPATAKEAYASCRKDIDRLLGWLDLELDRHRTNAKADPEHWSPAADLAEVRRRLVETLAYITGEDAESIRKDLNS